jgi:hypothetical protein
MRLASAWLTGTAVFALGMLLADRWFWEQCSGLAASRYGELWICSNAFAVRIALAAAAGLAAGLLARRRAGVLGVLVALAGVAAISLGYRPLFAFTQLQAVLYGILYFVLPTVAAAYLGSFLSTRRGREHHP